MVYMNPLETEEDIKEYKEWLASKGTYYLKCVLGNYKRDKAREKPRYLKVDLRIKLATKEFNKRIH